MPSGHWPPRSRREATPTSCCSAWAGRASAPRCSPRPSAASQGSRVSMSWTRPIPRGSALSRRSWTWPARYSSWPRSQARHWSPISSSSTSSTGWSGRWAEAGRRVVAITDPGSKLEKGAAGLGIAHVFHGVPSIGGRYSALSNFGLVPAAVMGVDVARLLDRAEEMVACAASVQVTDNPGAQLGLLMGLAAKQGLDKLTILTSPRLRALGAWFEQLVAESTGKQGKGIIPVDLERLGPPQVYGADRLFVHVALEGDAAPAEEAALAAVERAGHPVGAD